MNVTVPTSVFAHAMRVMAPVLARPSERVYGCEIAATTHGLTITVLSDDWTMHYTTPAAVESTGSAWIPGALLRAIPWPGLGETLTLARRPDRMLDIRSDSGVYSVATLAPGSAPRLRAGTLPAATVPGATLAALLRLGSLAACGHPSREGNAWLRSENDTLVIDSYDGAWLSRASSPTTVSRPITVPLPARIALTLAQAARDGDATSILLHPHTPILTLASGPLTLTVRSLAMQTVTTRRVPDPDDPPDVSVPAPRLASALRHAVAIAGTDPTAPVRVRLSEGALTIALDPSPDHDQLCGFATSLPAQTRGAGEDTVSGRALLRSVAPLGSETVMLGFARGGRGLWVAATIGDIRYRGLVPAQASRIRAPALSYTVLSGAPSPGLRRPRGTDP